MIVAPVVLVNQIAHRPLFDNEVANAYIAQWFECLYAQEYAATQAMAFPPLTDVWQKHGVRHVCHLASIYQHLFSPCNKLFVRTIDVTVYLLPI